MLCSIQSGTGLERERVEHRAVAESVRVWGIAGSLAVSVTPADHPSIVAREPVESAILDRRVPQLQPTQVRTIGLALAVGTVAIAIFVTQWPFEYRLTWFAMHARWNRIDWSWFPRNSAGNVVNRDFVQNLLMLIPLGGGFALWRRAAAVRVLAESLALGILTGAALELAQLVTRFRYTSFPDLWRNALGCLVGGLVVVTIRKFRMRHL